MRRSCTRGVLLAALICIFTVAGQPADRAEAGRQEWLTGDVVVQSDAGLETIVVTVDVDAVGEPADGSVDSAFRIQQPSVLIDYQGPARVGYALGELVIEPLDGATQGFGFRVAPANGGTLSNGSLATAVGIARFWGARAGLARGARCTIASDA